MRLTAIDLEVANSLKKLDFNWHCKEGFFFEDPMSADAPGINWNNSQSYLSAPEQALVLKWLREVHDIHIVITQESIGSDEYTYVYTFKYLPKEFQEAKRRIVHYVYEESFKMSHSSYSGGWDTYEEAELMGIKRAINYLTEPK